MKLNAQKRLEIRAYLEQVTIDRKNIDELFDHIVTDLEQRSSFSKVDAHEIKKIIDQEFDILINTERDKRNYRRLNNVVGLSIFFFALTVYWLTMEPTVSFWDCGEFIAAAFKMEVGHQPGAPLFLVVGKLFSFLPLGDLSKVAYWVNFSSVVASAATIMFLFWTITALASSIFSKDKLRHKKFSIISTGVIGALAYTFSDTFWFSAVEAEVYALSSLFTAITFWAILKWERYINDRWLIFIAFMIGLSTGVHLLSLLTIPAIALVYYFKKTKTASTWGVIKALIVGCCFVIVVQFGILQYFVLAAFKADLLFVNGLGFSFGSGALFFILITLLILVFGIWYSARKEKYQLNLSLICTGFILLGFSSYMMIAIRANANPPINLSDPDNAYSLYNYLGRTNYGSTPLLYGNTFDAERIDSEITGKAYRKGEKGYEVAGNTYKAIYDKNLLFPRTHSQEPHHVKFYRSWMGLGGDSTPTFAQNLGFFTSWQVGVMYWRYFLWNFSGKQNDIQGYGDIKNGNWITGIKVLDTIRLGNQEKLPPSIANNEGNNVFYGLPFLLGLAGIYWLFRRKKQVLTVVMTLFFFTGLAIIIYLNQDPMQVRERDYAYVGSFYAFAIFIGFGFLLVKDVIQRITAHRVASAIAMLLCLFAAPFLMGTQGWDDHDRSGKTTALAWAKNYLDSCAPNAILFTNADNDTYPLWYVQEVEGYRTDVRVINYQFLHDASFIDQMKVKVNESEPLPLSSAHATYKTGERDFFPYVDYGITDSVELKDLIAVMTSNHKNDQVQMADGSFMNSIPARKLKLTIDAEQLIDTNTIHADQESQVVSEMEWSFDKSYATKADLVIFDILATNNWERPIYFATSVSADTYVGLDKYLYLEGYAYRLLPINSDEPEVDKTQRTNTDVMYSNLMNKLDFSSFHQARYLDVESRRVINGTWQLNNALTANLLKEDKVDKAKDILLKSMRDLPLRNYSIADTLNKLNTVQNLYALEMTEVGNGLAKATTDFVKAELLYVATLAPAHQASYRDEVQLGLYVLDELQRMTARYQQVEIHQQIRQSLEQMLKAFAIEA
ncbi:glycosyltransferase family 117 protein [Albibacterium indicum]|uniref:glycosyltransferase family 117 protein n=1 Tax=Albibacterium indicum TaxID=2292082 RepID=UPI000E54BD46|nr:DUF2723 domain-containing protein [Pedobacter indicus]